MKQFSIGLLGSKQADTLCITHVTTSALTLANCCCMSISFRSFDETPLQVTFRAAHRSSSHDTQDVSVPHIRHHSHVTSARPHLNSSAYHGQGHGPSTDGSWNCRRFHSVLPVGACIKASPPRPVGMRTIAAPALPPSPVVCATALPAPSCGTAAAEAASRLNSRAPLRPVFSACSATSSCVFDAQIAPACSRGEQPRASTTFPSGCSHR